MLFVKSKLNAKSMGIHLERPLFVSIPIVYVVLNTFITWIFLSYSLLNHITPLAYVNSSFSSVNHYLIITHIIPSLYMISAAGAWFGRRWAYNWLLYLLFTSLFLIVWDTLYQPELLYQTTYLVKKAPEFVLSLIAIVMLFASPTTKWYHFSKNQASLLFRFTFWTGLAVSCGITLILR